MSERGVRPAGPGSAASGPLVGLRVLVAEDEALIAMLVEEMLVGLGCEVVAVAARVADAMRLVNEAQFDAAVLDVNLHGQTIFPVADALTARGVPIVFATGYGSAGLPEAYALRPTVQKPFHGRELAAVLLRSLAATAPE
jgi:CheY-like chemotaxis protein